jgi:hypothetical protein
MVYVVERYLPGLTRSNLLGTLADLERATEELREGPAVRYLGSTIVIGDEACFCQFEATSEGAVAEANRKAGLSFDRIVPAVTVSPTNSNRGRSQMNASTTVPVRIRMRRRWPFVAIAALLAAGTTVALLAITNGSDTSTTVTHNGVAASSAEGTSLTRSAADERQYVRAISSMTPAELSAAFGSGDFAVTKPTPGEQRYIRAISSLTPAQISAAFGSGAVAPKLSPREERYVDAMAALSPEQIAAAYGTGR